MVGRPAHEAQPANSHVGRFNQILGEFCLWTENFQPVATVGRLECLVKLFLSILSHIAIQNELELQCEVLITPTISNGNNSSTKAIDCELRFDAQAAR